MRVTSVAGYPGVHLSVTAGIDLPFHGGNADGGRADTDAKGVKKRRIRLAGRLQTVSPLSGLTFEGGIQWIH
jgi:hypothetical protein